MKVPQFKPWIGDEEIKQVKSAIDSDWITEGPKSQLFTKKLLSLIGAKYGVLAPNDSLALFLGLKALDIGRGDEVIVPDYTMIATATAVELTGATPVFVDVNRKNFQIDLERADEIISKSTKAVMPVHMYGTVANMDHVMGFAKRHGLFVIEDAAQAIGVKKDGVHAGNFGDVGCFSFFADKTITTAEGGFVVTNNKNVYKKLLYLRNVGRIGRGTFIHPKVGYNLRLTDIQAALGLAQLSKLEKVKERKKHILSEYKKRLEMLPEITIFEPDTNAEWVPFRVPILLRYRNDLIDYLDERNIEARKFFYPLHKQPAFSYLKKKRPKYFRYEDESFPNSIYAAKNGVTLPTFVEITDKQITYVCDSIKVFLDKKRKFFYKYYDLLYKDKEYKAETKMVLDLYKKYGNGRLDKILEIGSGTGNHTKQLSKLESSLTAIDTDEKMVELAKDKFKSKKNNHVRIVHTPIEELTDKDFDLALALFNVVTYIDGRNELLSFFKGIYQRLNKGGVFVFDCWNGIAAIKDPPRTKTLKARFREEKITAKVIPATDYLKQTTKLDYEITVRNGKRVEKGGFSFKQTLWTPKQIREALVLTGFEILLTSPFMQPYIPAKDTDWKIMFVAQKL